MVESIDVVVLGSGHYVTGQTSLSPATATDKDRGIVLPSLLYLRSIGKVGKITIVGQSSEKLEKAARALRDDELIGDVDKSFISISSSSSESPIEEALNVSNASTAVVIALPDHLHKDAILHCVKRRLPFLVLKPAVLSLADFYEVVRNIPFGLTAMVDYHKVYDQANLLIRDKVESGDVGQVQFVSSVMSQRQVMLELYRRWLGSDKAPNVNHYLGSHYIHLTSKIIGAEPVQVRATQQFAKASKMLGSPVADRIETHVLWRRADGTEASSFHLAGWTDSIHSPYMTRQELEIFGSHGCIRSDQSHRGISIESDFRGSEVPNPYFFGPQKSASGIWDPSGLYGFESISAFVHRAIDGEGAIYDGWAPTFQDSEMVTSILEGADLSLSQDSAAVSITRNSLSGELELEA